MVTTIVALLVCGLFGGAGDALAQAERPSITGTIVDATTGQRLEGVLVTLVPLPDGLIRGDGGLAPAQVQATGPDGRYAFASVAPGRYRLRIERIGFRGAILETEVRRPIDTRISVGLELEPLALEPVHVIDRAAPPFRRVAGGPREPETARASLERQRQELFLTPDSRVVTLADLQDGVTLGESDVFRALQRFPGIATRDDYTAELWTRGAPWAHTRVTFDDVPLFNPVHAVGVFSGIATDALGAVFLHTGVRPVALGEGAAGAVELKTRPAGGSGELRGAADVSMASAKLTLEQRPGNGRGSWLVSARRSYLDVFTGGFDWLGLGELDLPFAFHDVTARADVPLGPATLEASLLWEDDRLFGDVSGVVERTTASWGNTAGRVSVASPVGGLALRGHAGFSRYGAHIREAGDRVFDTRGQPWIEPETDNSLLHLRLVGEVSPVSAVGEPVAWSAGWELVVQHADYDGPEPRLHPVRPDTARRIVRDDALVRTAFRADRRLAFGPLTVQPGVRFEFGSEAKNVGSARFAPRLHTRLALGSGTQLSLAAGRTWQDLQALALAGPSAHPAFHAGQFWLQAGEEVPALRADQVTAGLEQWLGSQWLLGGSAWIRESSGVTLPDPRVGRLDRRPLYVPGEGSARGAEASLRKVAGRLTVNMAYAWSRADVEALGHTFPSPADRRHRVDATAAVRIVDGLRAGLGWTAMSGAPYTRVFARAPSPQCELFGFGCGQVVASVEAPNAERTPDYRSLDAVLVWGRGIGSVEVTAYLQIRNVLDRDNASTYSGTVPRVVRGRDGSTRVNWIDRFEAGLPRMPLFGARIAF